MIHHYILVAWRNLLRNKVFTVINILGFAIGISCALLLGMYSWHELNYDNFHEKKESIYLVGAKGKTGTEEWEGGWSTPPVGPQLASYFDEIETFTRLCFWFDEVIVNVEGQKLVEEKILGADSSVFNLFTMQFISGNPTTALVKPNSIVITETAAKKYFGDENPMGKSLVFDHFFSECVVTGVVKDYPDNSHFDFNILLSMSSLKTINFNFEDSWNNHTFVTYLLLNKNVDSDKVERKFDQFLLDRYEPFLIKKYGKSYKEMYASGDYYSLFLAPLSKIHLSTYVYENMEGKKMQIIALGIIGMLILALAIVNYINLSTAIASGRAKEIGIRKTVGSGKISVIIQFIFESIFIVFLGMLIGILILDIVVPHFNQMTGKDFQLEFSNLSQVFGLLGFTLGVGIIGGIYPALVISAYKPISILQRINLGAKGNRSLLRNILVVFQFVICIVMVISTIMVYKQLNHMQNIDVGFNQEEVMVIKRPWLLNKSQDVFKQRLLTKSNVNAVSFARSIPGGHFDGHGQHIADTPKDQLPTIFPFVGDQDLLKTLGLEVVQGQGFDDQKPNQKVALLNEAAVDMLQVENPLDIIIDNGTMGKTPYTVVGIVKDFHFNSFRHKVKPLIIYPNNNLQDNQQNFILVKLDNAKSNGQLEEIKAEWNKLSNSAPFDYTFLDQNFARLHLQEKITARVYTIFSIISIFIASLGLLGLISYFTIKRMKEIGIRKIVGASTYAIVLLLSKELTKWLGLAIVIGMPLSWYLTSNWIDNFAYKTEHSWWVFVTAGILVFLIVLATVSYQTIKAALANPVDALKGD